ncbi:MAG: hypothetical protein JWN52_3037 [Actinomycetia bacterium]|jgi:hypothetical protein|nr:hypothetical protein [Actinomycetes bacterium]
MIDYGSVRGAVPHCGGNGRKSGSGIGDQCPNINGQSLLANLANRSL